MLDPTLGKHSPLDTESLKIPNVWRAESLTFVRNGAIATGHSLLDAALGGGWPSPALIEVLCNHEGIGELQLLSSLFQPRSPSPCAEQRCVVLWLNAPFQLHALALAQLGLDPSRHWCADTLGLADTLWAMEQALRSGSCALVVAWAPRITLPMLRRLKLAAVGSGSVGVLFRPASAAAVPSPATLRLRLRPQAMQLHVELLKVQGRRPCALQVSVAARTQRSPSV